MNCREFHWLRTFQTFVRLLSSFQTFSITAKTTGGAGINVYWERFQNETKMKLLKKYLVT